MGLLKLRPIQQKKNFTEFTSLFFVITLLFAIAIFAVILYNAYDENIRPKMAAALTASTPEDANANVTKILEQASGGIGKLNVLFPLLMVGVFGYVLILAYVSRSHPAMFFVGILVLGVALIIAAMFSNVYEAITDTPAFTNAADSFGVMTIIMNNLPIIVFLVFLAISIIIYAMRNGPAQGGAY